MDTPSYNPTSLRLPILTFHAIEARDRVSSFPPFLLARALSHWYSRGWRTLSLSDAVTLLADNQPFPVQRFVLTFDDGYASVFRAAFPLLQQYGMTATVFVCSGEQGETKGETPLPKLFDREMLRWREIREMHAHGITFGAHTLTHPDLTQLSERDADREIHQSQMRLANALGASVKLFAYPYGKFNPRERALAARYFDAACADRLGFLDKASDPFDIERIETYYLRAPWAADGMTRAWFPLYLALRNVPRVLRRLSQ